MMYSGDEDFGDDITSGIDHQDEENEAKEGTCPYCGALAYEVCDLDCVAWDEEELF